MKREIWIDNVKVIACVLVVFGHFFQSMVKANIMQDSALYQWFDTTIYYFHVPLFFICSGYLFQKNTRIDSISDWGMGVLKKLIALGIPYIVFSTDTWVLKRVFSSSVNTQLGSLSYTLFERPASPYWYLYILFIIFVVTIPAKNKKTLTIYLAISFLTKIISLSKIKTHFYFIDNTFRNWIWFVLGMAMAYGAIRLANLIWGIALFAVFVVGSYVVFDHQVNVYGTDFILGLAACFSIVSIISGVFTDKKQGKVWAFCARYTMPIFLMHTLFAAPLRSVLVKIGISNPVIHIVLGVLISFAGPVIAMLVMEKIKPLDFFVYPLRYIKFSATRKRLIGIKNKV